MSYNLVVFGGGPAGYTAALRGATLGAKVALIEKSELGGLCLNKGCIPTKTFYHAASLKGNIKKMPRWGISVKEEGFNFEKVADKKEFVISALRKGIDYLLKARKVDFFKGEGTLVSPSKIKVGEDILETENILIATGTYAAFPSFLTPDGKGILSSDDILNLRALPSSLLVVGAGVMGLEFASIFRAFGTEVSVVEIMPEILPLEDPVLAVELKKLLVRQGLKFYTNARLEEMKYVEDKVSVSILTSDGRQELQFEKVLIATGRKPLLPVGSKEIGLTTNNTDTIFTKEDLSTDVKGIYCAGDVTSKIQLAHIATHMGLAAVENALLKKSNPVDLTVIPRVTYTLPPLALTGLTLKEATEAGYNAKRVTCPWSAIGMALVEEVRDGFLSMTVEEGSDRILGVQILGEEAPNLIGEGTVLVQERMTLQQLSEIIHPHPTLGEIYMEAGEIGRGLALHFFQPIN